MCKNQKNLENDIQRFNCFVNKTILGASKDYYRKELEKKRRELRLLDNQSLEENFEDYLQYSQSFFEIQSAQNAIEFINLCENLNLFIALKSLSAIEQTVIFFQFSEELTNEETGKALNLHPISVSRIKNRALSKLKKILKEGDFNE